jgi:hypothetical protein
MITLIFIIVYISIITLYIIALINSIINWVPLVSTYASDFKVMKKWLKKYNLDGKKIIDLWSGIWKATRFFKKNFNTKTYWIEIDLWSYIISKILNFITKSDINISKWNYLKADLSQYDFIYIYLFPWIISKIEEKIWIEAKTWTIVFSNAFKFNKHIPIEIIKDEKWKEEIYVYKI